MQPTDILMNEHRIIEQVLACLEKMADRCADNQTLDVESVEIAIDFFRVFADGCHHGKEEDLLFPAMESKGFSAQQGPTGVMRSEHEQGRLHIGAIENAIHQWSEDETSAGGDRSSAISTFVQHAKAYVSLLRQHIEKEDHCLFPMANQTLAAEEQQQLLQAFTKAEHEVSALGTRDKYVALANDLADRYEVARTGTVNDSVK